MASAPPSISQDASSLRAAALLTLKSKTKPRYHPPSRVDRPSPDDASSVASTRRAAQSPELNYGSDDGLADAEGSTEEDGEGEKEEGEISDDEAGAGVKASPMLMDIDNEPLPGLTASSITPRSSEDASGLRHRGHNTPPTSLVPTAPKAVTLSTSVNSDSATSGPRSSTIVPDHPSITSSAASAAAKPTSHGAPAVEVGSRSSNRSPVTKIPTPPPRTSSSSNKPSLSFTSDATSRFITPRIPHRDADRRATDPVPNLERSKANRHTSPSPPVFSRQVNSKPSLSTLASLDNTHVRPSLSMTAEEFIEAKSIILDLLGWGVPSEYFINCGLTREAIFYAFTELNLKLPNNLNTQGIVPYGPPADYVPESTLAAAEHQNPGRVEPTSMDIHRPPEQSSRPSPITSTKPTDRRASLTGQTNSGPVKLGIPSTAPPHPLPPKPRSGTSPPASPSGKTSATSQGYTNGRVNPSSSGLASNPTPSVPSDSIPGLQGQLSPFRAPISGSYSMKDAPTHGYSGNLDEIETLRRQELLARKAVLASRKPKAGAASNLNKPSSTPGPSSPSVQIPRIPSPPPLAKSPPRTSSSNSARRPPVLVETVDDFLKSITSGPSTDSISVDDTSGSALPRSPESVDMDVDSNPRDGPISAGSRGAPWNHAAFAHSSSSMDPTSGQPRLQSRKSSMKRPVASDFVDFDATSHDSFFATTMAHNDSSNGHGRGTLSSTPSFANLAPARKVIIDFSDTEDEADENEISRQPEDRRTSHPSVVSSGSASLGTSASNAPTPEPGLVAQPLGVSPEALILKEKEIRRMKEMIAERERNRLKKLANPPSITPPPPPPPPRRPSSEGSSEVVVQEDVVRSMDQDDVHIICSSVHSGDGSATSAAGDVIDEDAIVHDIFAQDVSNPDLSTTSTPPSTGMSAPEMQDVVMGEQDVVLVAEAGHEQVVDPETSPPVDQEQAQDSQLDMQSEENEEHTAQVMSRRFLPYHSPLSPFASFRSPSQLDSISTVDDYLSSTLTSPLPFLSLDTPISQQLSALLRPLKEGTLLKLDPKRGICQFEIPGAGKCRDATCANIHLRAFDPNDDETAHYLAKVLPAPQPTAQAVKAALSRVRASQQELDLDARISQTLLQLGVR